MEFQDGFYALGNGGQLEAIHVDCYHGFEDIHELLDAKIMNHN